MPETSDSMTSAVQWAWLAPVFCVAAFTVIVVLGRFLPRQGAHLSVLAILGGFVIFWYVLTEFLSTGGGIYQVDWFTVGDVTLSWGIIVDELSIVMLGLVTLVALAVQVYSLSYMKDEPAFGWYFAVHSLFAAAMLTLILADNFLLLYIAWELVGPLLLPVDRLLVPAPLCGRGGQEGLYHHADWRRGASHRHPAAVQRDGHFRHCHHNPRCRAGRNKLRDADGGAAAHLPGRNGQVRPVPAARVAARRHGGSDAGQRSHPRSDDGGCRRVPCGAHLPPLRPLARRDAGGGRHWPHYSPRRGGNGPCDDRPQAGAGLLHHKPPWIYDAGPGSGRIHRRYLSPGGTRLREGAALPGRRQRHPRHRQD